MKLKIYTNPAESALRIKITLDRSSLDVTVIREGSPLVSDTQNYKLS